MTPFNINDTVRVRLTPHGRTIHRANHDAFIERVSEWGGNPDWVYRAPEEDAHGWSEWQLWSLMEQFGPHIHLGGRNPFDTTIELDIPPHPSQP